MSKLQQLDSMPNLKFQAFLDKNHSSNKAFFSQKFTAQVHTCLISQQFVVSPRVIQFPHSCFCTAIRYVLLPFPFPYVFNTNGRLVMLWILSVYIYFAVSADCIRGDLGTSQLWFCTLSSKYTTRPKRCAVISGSTMGYFFEGFALRLFCGKDMHTLPINCTSALWWLKLLEEVYQARPHPTQWMVFIQQPSTSIALGGH